MEEMIKNFNLKKEITDLVEKYFCPPSNWRVLELGIFKYNRVLNSFCIYAGQGIPEPIYNKTAEYVIDIMEQITDYFDISGNLEDYTEKEKSERINFICENVIEQIKEFEENAQIDFFE